MAQRDALAIDAEALVGEAVAAVRTLPVWALRMLAPWQPKAVEAFVAEYEGRLAPRVKREVGNKLRTGLKNPRA